MLHPTAIGEDVIRRLKDSGFSFLRDDYTRAMEQRLDDIANRKMPYLEVVRGGYDVLVQELQQLPNAQPRVSRACGPSAANVSGGPSATGNDVCGHCVCGGEIIERPKSWTCQGCQATVWKKSFGKTIKLKEALALLAGKTVSLKGLKSKAGKKFDADAVLEAGKLKLVF